MGSQATPPGRRAGRSRLHSAPLRPHRVLHCSARAAMDRWTPDEDRRLCELVNDCRSKQTPKIWMHISQIINRTPLAARSHWDRMVQGEAKVRAGLAKNKCERCGAFRLGHVCGEKNRSVFSSQPERLEVAAHKLARRTRVARINDFEFVNQNNFILNASGRVVRPLEPEREPEREPESKDKSHYPGALDSSSLPGLERAPGLADIADIADIVDLATRSRPPSPSTASTQPGPEGADSQEPREPREQSALPPAAAAEPATRTCPTRAVRALTASQLVKPYVRKRITQREWSASYKEIREIALRKLAQGDDDETISPKDRVLERRRVLEEAGDVLSAVLLREPFEHHIRSGSAISLQRKRAREEPPLAPTLDAESDDSRLVSDSDESKSDSN